MTINQSRSSLLSDVVCMSLMIKARCKRYGWLSGSYEMADGELVPVDVMPPVCDWEGRLRVRGLEPHATDWTVFIDGDEIGRVGSRDQIVEVIWRAIA